MLRVTARKRPTGAPVKTFSILPRLPNKWRVHWHSAASAVDRMTVNRAWHIPRGSTESAVPRATRRYGKPLASRVKSGAAIVDD